MGRIEKQLMQLVEIIQCRRFMNNVHKNL